MVVTVRNHATIIETKIRIMGYQSPNIVWNNCMFNSTTLNTVNKKLKIIVLLLIQDLSMFIVGCLVLFAIYGTAELPEWCG